MKNEVRLTLEFNGVTYAVTLNVTNNVVDALESDDSVRNAVYATLNASMTEFTEDLGITIDALDIAINTLRRKGTIK